LEAPVFTIISDLLVIGGAVVVASVFCRVASWLIDRDPAAQPAALADDSRRVAPGPIGAPNPNVDWLVRTNAALLDWVVRMLTCPLDQPGRVIVVDIAAVYALGGAA
jgi:hypothetical protein